MELRHIVFRLVLYVGWGTIVSLGCVRPSYAGRAFYVYHGLGAALLTGFTFVLTAPTVGPGVATGLWCFVVAAAVYSISAERFPVVSYAALAVALASGLFSLFRDVTTLGTPYPVIDAVLSALLLGFSMGAMILGHWYLIQPKLPIVELRRLTLVFLGVLVLRIAFEAYDVFAPLSAQTSIEQYLLGTSTGLFLLMRWTWGLIAPLVLGIMVWKTVQIRSTQSATGILYVVVLSVLTGEILSQYLLSRG